MKRWLLTVLLLAGGCGEDATSQPTNTPPPQKLPTTQVSLGGKTFTLEVADEDKEREIGLMHRHSMPADAGMIFCFPEARSRSFWMRETHLPLDIIYLDENQRIVSIKQMKPLDLSGVRSDGPAKFAIELNAGMAKSIGLQPGQTVELPEALRDAGQ